MNELDCMCVCVCVSVCMRERERVCVCLNVCCVERRDEKRREKRCTVVGKVLDAMFTSGGELSM